MPRLLERRVIVRAPLAAAWGQLARVADWPSWARHIRRIDLSPPGEVGPASEGRIVLRNGARSRFRVTEFEPRVHWKWTGRVLGMTVDYDHRFREAGPNETEIELTLDAPGLRAGTLGRFFARLYASQLDRALPRLQRELEASQRAYDQA